MENPLLDIYVYSIVSPSNRNKAMFEICWTDLIMWWSLWSELGISLLQLVFYTKNVRIILLPRSQHEQTRNSPLGHASKTVFSDTNLLKRSLLLASSKEKCYSKFCLSCCTSCFSASTAACAHSLSSALQNNCNSHHPPKITNLVFHISSYFLLWTQTSLFPLFVFIKELDCLLLFSRN